MVESNNMLKVGLAAAAAGAATAVATMALWKMLNGGNKTSVAGQSESRQG